MRISDWSSDVSLPICFAPGAVQRLVSVAGGNDVEILARQFGFEQLDVRRHVVNDQDTGRHRLLAQITLNGLDESGDGDRLGDVILAPSLAYLLFVPLHGDEIGRAHV